MRWIWLAMMGAGAAVLAGEGPAEVVFREDFRDPALPAWRRPAELSVKISPTTGPDGGPAIFFEAAAPGTGTVSASLPAEKLAGRGVMLDVWRKADDLRTGEQHYLNAKAMLSWKARSAAKPQYSTTLYSDFSGTFDWERHRYVVEMPPDLEWASVTIGLQACTGKASWADLNVCVDSRFPTQAALERFLADEARQAYADIDPATLELRGPEDGDRLVFSGRLHVPRAYWTDGIREAVLAAVPPQAPATAAGKGLRGSLAEAFRVRAAELTSGLAGLSGAAANDRACEVVGLRHRVRQLGGAAPLGQDVRLRASGAPEKPVPPLLFGNNINAQNLSAPYDSERGRFQDEFLARVRPLRITFLRYPGGCNADVFDWQDTVGPVAQRRDLINYHDGSSRGTPRFGVDEYLRFCQEEGMTPILTTAFCKDHPAKVDPTEHPKGIRHPFVVDYMKSAPDRVQLAADWVEYCNGPADSPMGRLRARHGHPEPYRVKYWEIGNESYGPDPVGSCSPEEYARAFPAYVAAMKARDPGIAIVMNGGPTPEWNDTVLRLAGKHADAYQIHIYLTPRIGDYGILEGRPKHVTAGMRLANGTPGILARLDEQMRRHLGRTMPVFVTEFGMGNAKNREFMTSVTSAVLVADMWRALIESPLITGANKWCLYTGYWFSQIQGPTSERPDAPYYNRPEHVLHEIYARCRGPASLPVDHASVDGARAVVFRRPDSYGVVLISREAETWQSIHFDIPGATPGPGECLLVTAAHPFLGNENDHELVREIAFSFEYSPDETIPLPPNAVLGLVLPRGRAAGTGK
ncbi:MAG: hypothetical protein JXR77_18575 [Lentisphaeria bacterium]|nr:hypothetical protein [Lentisphaeria bacterium]